MGRVIRWRQSRSRRRWQRPRPRSSTRGDHARSTRRVYAATMAALTDGLGAAMRVDELDPAGTAAWFRLRYGAAAPATWNRELATLRSAAAWWRAQGWLDADPTALVERRHETPDRTNALTVAQVQRLSCREDVALRDKTLRRLLYETAARATEILSLDVGDLDLANKRARVRSKGGATEWVFWQGGAAQLLPRLLSGRSAGPVFLADRRPTRAVATWTRTAPPDGPGCPTGGPPTSSPQGPAGRCTSCGTLLSPTPPRTAPTSRCCSPDPGTPRCARSSAMHVPARRRWPATSPPPTRPGGGP